MFAGNSFWARLGPSVHENGRSAVQHCRESEKFRHRLFSRYHRSTRFQQNVRTSNLLQFCYIAQSIFRFLLPRYELYDPCTVMFFFRNKHIMIDLGTGNNNKINWPLEDKQEMVDIVETVYRGARKGRGLVVSPKDYSTKYRY